MEEIFGYIALVVVFIMGGIGVYHEVKCMKVNRTKAEEEISLIRHCIYLMEQNCTCSFDWEQ